MSEIDAQLKTLKKRLAQKSSPGFGQTAVTLLGMKKSVRLPAFAKINLCLHVLGRRPDGYHELRTIFQAISLHDTLELSLDVCPGTSLWKRMIPDLPLGRRISFTARSKRFAARSAFAAAYARDLEKRIPVARGLGGGSSDAAAALIGDVATNEEEGAARRA